MNYHLLVWFALCLYSMADISHDVSGILQCCGGELRLTEEIVVVYATEPCLDFFDGVEWKEVKRNPSLWWHGQSEPLGAGWLTYVGAQDLAKPVILRAPHGEIQYIGVHDD